MKITYTTPFTMIANDIIQSEKLNIYQKMVYMVLCSHTNQSNACFPSYSTIARECGCFKRKVIDTISELEDLAYIIVHRYKDQYGKHKSNEYEIAVENIVDKSAVGADGATDSESDALSKQIAIHKLSYNKRDMIVNREHYKRMLIKQSFDTENVLLDNPAIVDISINQSDLSAYDAVIEGDF